MTKKGDTVAIIQARMGSTRLPGKVLEHIAGKPMLWHVFNRAKVASTLDRTVVATTTKKEDDEVEEFCKSEGIPVFRGSESDVLDRYYHAASDFSAQTVVRITADCPLVSPEVIDRVVRIFEETEAYYASNTLRYTYPDGLDVEVFSFDTLEEAWREADGAEEREHVTPYMKEAKRSDIVNVTNNVRLEGYSFYEEGVILRWSVDYPEDLEFIRKVYSELYKNGEWTINQSAVLELLERRPEIIGINEDIERVVK